MLFTLCLSLLLISSGGAAERPDMKRKPALGGREVLVSIPVDVFAPSDTRDSFVNHICAEMAAIWRRAGMTFDCHRVTSQGRAATRPGRLNVTIDDSRKGAALGWVRFRDDNPDLSIHLSRAGAEDLLLRTGDVGDTGGWTHEMLIERALGRTLSHELGHYLLKSKAHTSHGLMRANWPSREVFAMQREGFELTAEEREAAARRLRQSTLADPSADATTAPAAPRALGDS